MINLKNINNCSACGACLNICPVNAISWKKSDHFVEMPQIDEKSCISCKKCVQICPQGVVIKGRYPSECFAAWLKSEKDLKKTSSGGAAYAFSFEILRQNGVVFGAVFQNGKVKHIAANSEQMLDSLCGSKYVWSDVEKTFSEVKKLIETERKNVLYIGTPCQIAGLKCYLGNKKYDNLYLIDLICHGVPPAEYITQYVKAVFGGEPETLSFRNRSGAILSGILKNGNFFHQKTSGSFSDEYMQSYISGLIYRENCHNCKFANPERISDITLGDFWGINRAKLPKNAPELLSVIFINTEQGKRLMQQAAENMETVPYPVAECCFGKDNLKTPSLRPAEKDLFYSLLKKNSFLNAIRSTRKKNPIIKKYLNFVGRANGYIIRRFCTLFSKKITYTKPLVEITTINESYMLDNYGTFLQHYSLRKVLKDNGFSVCRNVWEPEAYKGIDEGVRWWMGHLFSLSSAKKILKIILTKFSLYKKISCYAALQYFLRPMKFRMAFTKLIGPWRERIEQTPDFCLAGSDQVFFWWDFNGQYRRFMKNAPASAIKISYAASSNWYTAKNSEVWRASSAELLKDYHAISVRERIGQEFLQELLPEKDVAHVLDPTMLLTKQDYFEILPEKKYFRKPTLLCYLLHCDKEKLHLAELEQIAAELGCNLKIIGVQGTENFVPLKYGISPAPIDFLRAYRDADYIITNSFHGTVFSILFEKKWVSVSQKGANESSQNARHTELLKRLGLGYKAIDFSTDGILWYLRENVDWKGVQQLLGEERSYSKSWLLDSLRSKKND